MNTPLDFAFAGMRLWQVQIQAATLTGLRMAGFAERMVLPPTQAMQLALEKQAEMQRAGLRMVELFAEASPLRLPPPRRD